MEICRLVPRRYTRHSHLLTSKRRLVTSVNVFRYGKRRRINGLYLPPSGSSWGGLMHKGQEVVVVKIQNQMSMSGQNPAGFIQAPKEAPKTVLDSGRQLLRDHCGVCVPSHTPVERHLHACICRDQGNTHAQVRTSDSD